MPLVHFSLWTQFGRKSRQITVLPPINRLFINTKNTPQMKGVLSDDIQFIVYHCFVLLFIRRGPSPGWHLASSKQGSGCWFLMMV